MIELIIAVFILSFGVVAVFSVFYSIVSFSGQISYRITGIYLTQEGMEIIRNLRDNNFISKSPWSAGLLSCALGCQADYKTGTALQTLQNQLQDYGENNFLKLNADGFYSYDAGNNTEFKRKIKITQPESIQPKGADVLRVQVEVFWNYNKKPFNVKTIGYLYNWH